MVAALVLLLAGLGVSLYHYRGFWFPDTEEADYDQPAVSTPVTQPTQSAISRGEIEFFGGEFFSCELGRVEFQASRRG